MNYIKIKPVDVANGYGVRVSIYVAGCSRHCPGCFNSETWDYDAGEQFTSKTIDYIIELLDHEYIEGLTILGGEPLDPMNLLDVYELIRTVKAKMPYKNIWVYTGYTWEQVRHLPIMLYIDTLVDGPFIQSLADPSLAFRGSSNQNIINARELYLEKVIKEANRYDFH